MERSFESFLGHLKGLPIVSWYRNAEPSRTCSSANCRGFASQRAQMGSWRRFSHRGPSTSALSVICTQLGQHQMTVRFTDDSAAVRPEVSTYRVSCPAVLAGAHEHPGSTVCAEDFMSVSEAGRAGGARPQPRSHCLSVAWLRSDCSRTLSLGFQV